MTSPASSRHASSDHDFLIAAPQARPGSEQPKGARTGPPSVAGPEDAQADSGAQAEAKKQAKRVRAEAALAKMRNMETQVRHSVACLPGVCAAGCCCEQHPAARSLQGSQRWSCLQAMDSFAGLGTGRGRGPARGTPLNGRL